MPTGLHSSGGVTRCAWCGTDPLYVRYHDTEWGFPVSSDQRLFEKLSLEGFQSGLSWLTILRKRDNFRRAFADFDIARVAEFGSRDVRRLLADAGIVRHRGKIESVINNARRCLELRAEVGSLHDFVLRFQPTKGERPPRLTWSKLATMASTTHSVAMSRELKRRGWTFLGPTTAYAFMQAAGVVNDHLHGCDIRTRVEKRRRGREP